MLSEQQQAVVDYATSTNDALLVPAGAGCGKTSTLLAVAEVLRSQGRRVVYLAYNRPIKDEAKAKFGSNAAVFTAHGIAFGALKINQVMRNRKMGRIYPDQVVRALKLTASDCDGPLRDYANDVLSTMNRYIQTGDAIVTEACLPARLATSGVTDAYRSSVVDHAMDLFLAAAPGEKTGLPLPHDVYLKYWQVIGTPGLEKFDDILLDEAQDANPVILAALEGKRVIYVGDTHQQIYSFRGAIDAMNAIDAPELAITQSYRFGPVIAELANAVLSKKKNTPLKFPLKGLARLNTQIVANQPQPPCTRIYRTNYPLIADSFVLRDQGINTALNGDMRDLADQIESLEALRCGDKYRVRDPLIKSFASYNSLAAASQDNGVFARELRQIVRILTDFSARYTELLHFLRGEEASNPGARTVTFTTAHKSKGCEWDSVAIMADFDLILNAKDEYAMRPAQRDEELNLLYVAITRARRELNIQNSYLLNIAHEAGLIDATAQLTAQVRSRV